MRSVEKAHAVPMEKRTEWLIKEESIGTMGIMPEEMSITCCCSAPEHFHIVIPTLIIFQRKAYRCMWEVSKTDAPWTRKSRAGPNAPVPVSMRQKDAEEAVMSNQA